MAKYLQVWRPVTGTLLCAALALLASLVFAHRPFRAFVPLAFLAVIVLLGVRFGAAASVLGAGISALIFLWFMFPPMESLHVHDEVERSNIGWMLLGGIVLPYLLVSARTKQTK